MSFVELLILYELWAGERLVLEKAVPRKRRPERPISVSAVPFGSGIDIWPSCRFIGALFRALRALPGGVGRFMPCDIGANPSQFRHIGWEKCEVFLDGLLLLFQYPPGSASALLEGTLPLRYRAGRFACKVPTWRLPVRGHAADLVTEGREEVGIVRVEPGASAAMPYISGGGKTPAHLARHGSLGIQRAATCLKEPQGS